MTAPIVFRKLPPTGGDELADAPAAQARLAPQVDYNFALINPYVGAFPGNLSVRRVSGTYLLTWMSQWTWYNDYVANIEGWIYGDARVISFIGEYKGAKVVADSYGGITNQAMATLKDTRFLVGGGQEVWVAAAFAGGTAGLRITAAGVLELLTISEGKASLDPGDWISFMVAYLVR
jgi:hypothetical protein